MNTVNTLNTLSNLDLLNNEKIITLVISIAMLWVTFKIASTLLKPIIYIALIGALYMYVYHPASLRNQINTEVARLSPAANYAVAAFNECRNAGSPINSIEMCKQKIIDLAQQQNGGEFAAKAKVAVEMLIHNQQQNNLAN